MFYNLHDLLVSFETIYLDLMVEYVVGHMTKNLQTDLYRQV